MERKILSAVTQDETIAAHAYMEHRQWKNYPWFGNFPEASILRLLP